MNNYLTKILSSRLYVSPGKKVKSAGKMPASGNWPAARGTYQGHVCRHAVRELASIISADRRHIWTCCADSGKSEGDDRPASCISSPRRQGYPPAKKILWPIMACRLRSQQGFAAKIGASPHPTYTEVFALAVRHGGQDERCSALPRRCARGRAGQVFRALSEALFRCRHCRAACGHLRPPGLSGAKPVWRFIRPFCSGL